MRKALIILSSILFLSCTEEVNQSNDTQVVYSSDSSTNIDTNIVNETIIKVNNNWEHRIENKNLNDLYIQSKKINNMEYVFFYYQQYNVGSINLTLDSLQVEYYKKQLDKK